MIRNLLEHPLARGLDLDSVETTLIRRRIVKDKPFLKKLYLEWYAMLLKKVPKIGGQILELGSGAGFLKELDPSVLTSEVFVCEGVDFRIDACRNIPFQDNELKAVLMTDVFHHLPNTDNFFQEALRVLAPGGVISMIEPWVTSWSKFVYKKLHHEPFVPDAKTWRFESTGPLSGANGALPWIVFHRDKDVFEEKYPEMKIADIQLTMPVAYILSGGVSMRSLAPGCFYEGLRFLEKSLHFINDKIAMFAQITLLKKEDYK